MYLFSDTDERLISPGMGEDELIKATYIME